MNVQEILATLQRLAEDPLFSRVEVLDLTRHLVKARLYIREDLFIQVYRNDQSKVTNLLVVLEQQRIFARDEIRGQWHRHPFDCPTEHDTGPGGRKAVTLAEFVEEVRRLVVGAGLL